MAGVAFLKWRGLESTTKSYAKSVICATSASLRCIMRASTMDAASKWLDDHQNNYADHQ